MLKRIVRSRGTGNNETACVEKSNSLKSSVAPQTSRSLNKLCRKLDSLCVRTNTDDSWTCLWAGAPLVRTLFIKYLRNEDAMCLQPPWPRDKRTVDERNINSSSFFFVFKSACANRAMDWSNIFRGVRARGSRLSLKRLHFAPKIWDSARKFSIHSHVCDSKMSLFCLRRRWSNVASTFTLKGSISDAVKMGRNVKFYLWVH